jgi:hypothetical protein
MGYEFILFALALYKAYIHYREAPNKAWFGSRLVGVIVRNSIMYFTWFVFLHSTMPYLYPWLTADLR